MSQKSDINLHDFVASWRRFFGASVPLGHVLRHDYTYNWARFHALPDAKRYAETDAERATILDRANAVATEIFGKKAAVWLAVSAIQDASFSDPWRLEQLGEWSRQVWRDDHDPDEVREVTTRSTRIAWTPGALDELFGRIGDDELRALLFSEESQSAFAPYDGGFDIISFRPGLLADLERSFAAWMSERSDKL